MFIHSICEIQYIVFNVQKETPSTPIGKEFFRGWLREAEDLSLFLNQVKLRQPQESY